MSSPSDWAQFYQQQQSLSHQMVSSGINPANDPIATAQASGGATVSSTQTQTQLSPSPEGRVSKPARRRSRASRRTPTTLLNTDTTNFRAMVQQFTGGPSAPFGSAAAAHHPGGGGGTGASAFSLGQPGHVNHPGSVMLPPHGYNNRLQYQQNQQPWMISLSNNNQGDHHHHPHPHHQGLFVQRGNNNMEISDGFLMGNVSSSSTSATATARVRAPTNDSSFMF